MLLCKVHNTVTDQRYEFRADTQAEIDAKLERKSATYGRLAWTETVPGWIDPTTDPPTEHPEQVTEHPSERTVEVIDMSAADAADKDERDKREEARQRLRDLDWQTIADPVTRKALKDLWLVLKGSA